MFAESGASSDVASAWDDLPVLFSVQRALHRWDLQKSHRIIPSRAKYRVRARAFKCRPVATWIRIMVDLAESQNVFLTSSSARHVRSPNTSCMQIYRTSEYFFNIPPEEKQRVGVAEEDGRFMLCLVSHIYFPFSTVCFYMSGL